MNITILSGQGRSAYLAYRLKKEGHRVAFYVHKPAFRSVWENIDIGQVDKMPDAKRADLVLFDSIGGGLTADRLKSQGVPVLGSSTFLDELCSDREFAEIFLGDAVGSSSTKVEAEPSTWLGFYIPLDKNASVGCFKVEVFNKHLAGGLGVDVGSSMAWQVSHGGPSEERLLDLLQVKGVTGLVFYDVNKKVFHVGFENEAFWTWFARKEVTLTDLLLGKPSSERGVSAAVRLSIFPYPYVADVWEHILGMEEPDLASFYLYNVKIDLPSGKLKGAGHIGCCFHSGDSLPEVYLKIYSHIDKLVQTKGLQARVDLLEQWKLSKLSSEEQREDDERSEEYIPSSEDTEGNEDPPLESSL